MSARTLHPASVAVRSLSRSLNTGFLFFVIGVVVSPGGNGIDLLSVVGLVAIGIVTGIVYEFAYYRRFRYDLTDDTFDVTSGVIARRDRELPLGRIQNVDIRQNVIGRLLGIAAVHIETAGGGETEVSLRYVAETEAQRLRRQLRRGASAEADAAEGPTREARDRNRATDAATAPAEADETLLFEIRPRELAILSLFTIDPGASLLGGIALSFASGFDPMTLFSDRVGVLPGAETGLVALAWAVVGFLLAAWFLSATLTFTRYYDFRLTRVGDELYYERGLLQRYSGTIPLEKVQTLTISESVPFRWFGYAALSVETAGYAPGQDGRSTESAIPLADADRVAALARAIEPFGSTDLESPPRRARERYAVRYLLVVAAVVGLAYLVARYTTVVRDWYVVAALAALVPIAAHLKWTNRGYRVGDRYFLTRTGFWRRTTKVVPHYRVQAVLHQATIFQRRRRLASVTADTASSATFLGRAATAHDIDADRGLELQALIEERLQDRLRAHERQRTVGRWFRDAAESTRESDGDGDEN
ncbi:PH domain-containing protein [Natrinema salifodinae]|uniref:Putative membrane protein n=1 Tax=Natrinema salifodinae TaxID=1202768 RepID=A0A1I0QYF9_9EURY|nr:PH domain-containing protein [Natrinema salifodinae]SEW32442.1 putative membrane protein [Natrinema salifodinae]